MLKHSFIKHSMHNTCFYCGREANDYEYHFEPASPAQISDEQTKSSSDPRTYVQAMAEIDAYAAQLGLVVPERNDDSATYRVICLLRAMDARSRLEPVEAPKDQNLDELCNCGHTAEYHSGGYGDCMNCDCRGFECEPVEAVSTTPNDEIKEVMGCIPDFTGGLSMNEFFDDMYGEVSTPLPQQEEPALAEQIIRRVVENTVRCMWTRNIEPLQDDEDAEFPTEEELVIDALGLALGEDIGCLDPADEDFRERIDLLWLEDKLKPIAPLLEQEELSADLSSIVPLSRDQITPEIADMANKAVASHTVGMGQLNPDARNKIIDAGFTQVPAESELSEAQNTVKMLQETQSNHNWWVEKAEALSVQLSEAQQTIDSYRTEMSRAQQTIEELRDGKMSAWMQDKSTDGEFMLWLILAVALIFVLGSN